MPPQRKDGASGGSGGGPVRAQNGSRPGFRTDTAISNNRPGAERNLTRWVGDNSGLDGSLEGGSNSGGAKWDQFAANERLFGLKTDYNENYYTTAIDRSHPQYSERLAVAERAAREIEGSTATTAHVAEERVMDFVGGEGQGDGDEEDKYSGVRRQQDFPPLTATNSRGEAKYTPPARRAPTGHSTVVGAPVDPAIISSQIKGGPPRKQQQPSAAPKVDENKTPASGAPRPTPPAVALPQQAKTPEPKATEKPADAKQQPAAKAADSTSEQTKPAAASKPNSKPSTPAISSGTSSLRASATPNRSSLSPAAKASAFAPSTSAANSPAPANVADNVESALLKDFKDFATQQRQHAEKARHNKIKADAQVKLQELRRFADSFKLSTPVPNDLISIIAKDPAKQRQIQEKALQNAEELAKSKTESSQRGSASSASSAKPAPASSSATPAAATAVTSGATSNATNTASSTPGPTSSAASGPTAGNAAGPDNVRPPVNNNANNNGRPQGPPHAAHNASPSGVPNRHPNARGGYMQQNNFRQQSQPYRNDRSGPQHMSQGHNTGHLAERIRNSDQNQNRYNKNLNNHGPSHFGPSGDARVPPTGPANAADNNYSRRLSALPAGAHTPQKLNPTTHEFRPSPFAASFNPTGPSAGSSPRSAINHVSTDPSLAMSTTATSVPGIPSPRTHTIVLVRRKTQNVSTDKCNILSMVKSIKAPPGRNWDDNEGLRPSYDTPLLWRQIQDDEKPDSTMRLKYREYLERVAFNAATMATPVQGHAMPHNMSQMAHQHQLPAHMQHGHMGPRPNQHMPPMPMHGGGPHGHIPTVSFNGSDDHRMMASNSSQSYASPRMSQVPMYPPHVGSTPQMGYNQPAMPFMQNGPQMNQFRNYQNNPQGFMPQQSGPMMPMMPPQHFVGVPGGMMGGSQQMGMYPGQFMGPPGAGGAGGAAGAPPPHHMGGSNGYPSPGRPVAPMMGQQGSQQGQPMYGVSPSTQYQQPAFNPQHQGQGGKPAMRGGYNNPGAQHYGSSPQGVHQYGPQHRNGSGNYSGKNYQGHNNHNNSHHHNGPHQHQGSHSNGPPVAHQNRQTGGEGAEEAK